MFCDYCGERCDLEHDEIYFSKHTGALICEECYLLELLQKERPDPEYREPWPGPVEAVQGGCE